MVTLLCEQILAAYLSRVNSMVDIAVLIKEAELLLLESASSTDLEKDDHHEKALKLIETYLENASTFPLKPYELITRLAINHTIFFKSEFRFELSNSFKNKTLPLSEYSKLFHYFILHDIDHNNYFHQEWTIDDETFAYALDVYIAERKKRGCAPEELQNILLKDLAVLLTYECFTRIQAQALIEKLPLKFNPHKSDGSLFSRSLFERAKQFSNNEVVAYLEMNFPAPPVLQQEIFVDPLQFQGIVNLLSEDSPITKDTLSQDTFLKMRKMRTLTEIHSVCNIDASQYNPEFFIKELEKYKKEYPSTSPEQILGYIRNVYYQHCLTSYQIMKSHLVSGDIEVYWSRDILIDNNISGRGSCGHSDVGKLSFQGQSIVCKYQTTIDIMSKYNSLVQTLEELADFIGKVRQLKKTVPNVVEVLPCIFLNAIAGKEIKIGYFMELAPGRTLREITALSNDEKESIQAQFNESVELMLKSGYALYDLNDDNILWDGQNLTFIDLSMAGFSPKALQYADTCDVIYRLSMMLEKKELCRRAEGFRSRA